ncbi:hypothetical protein COV53_01590 [Candidatus Gottesmanbacteria bacterium CG11_big_fil_rev_8_21_14_0_20_37_11]|uniref:Uncharacterized protein n=2 Tax=Candidatus Gottesmaniibacteriota TaxID=1752720 RepID=A0A2M7RR38_9BACT|nr:MAG: hypothetical protein COV53_01590 [Candidatus Gottesmanbacteria bacterium CG11_big_fil_rev_8_21_14_0_20_37_11]PIZ02545.1 MAG: hypothetical protein COY59_04205 [Candidatus Gottesmanbacteria bacterium CG_4_10_14_0_8_um_filter_37_24]
MYKDPAETLYSILEIIGFDGDKRKFVTEFINVCFEQVYMDMLKDIPVHDQDNLIAQLRKADTQQALIDLLKPYIMAERLKSTLQVVTTGLFEDYLETIMPTLNEERKKKLLDFLASLSDRKAGVAKDYRPIN